MYAYTCYCLYIQAFKSNYVSIYVPNLALLLSRFIKRIINVGKPDYNHRSVHMTNGLDHEDDACEKFVNQLISENVSVICVNVDCSSVKNTDSSLLLLIGLVLWVERVLL